MNSSDLLTTPSPARELRREGLLVLAATLLILALRIGAFAMTRSLAVLADTIEPFFNLAAALVTLAGVTHARRPADLARPFGYRKLEFVAVGLQGVLALAGAGAVVALVWWQSTSPTPVYPTGLSIGLFALSIGLAAYFGRRLTATGERHASPAFRAAGRHARLDSLLGLAVLLNLAAAYLTSVRWVDPLLSLVIVVVTAWHALHLMSRAVHGLMDAASPAVHQRVIEALQARRGIDFLDFHDVRCRDAGGHVFIDFHLQFSDGTTLEEAHRRAEAMEDVVESTVPSGDAMAHIEPAAEVRGDRARPAPTRSERESARRRAAATSLATAIVVTAAKLVAAALTHSAAVLSDALESVVNVVAAGFAIFSVRLSRSGEDASHHYGHYKVEFFAAAFEGAMITLAAGLIIASAAPRLLHGAEVSNLDLGLAFVVGTAVVNALLGVYLVRRGRRLASLTLEADGRHVLTDVFTSGGVLIGLLVVRATGWGPADPLVAIAVALYILYTGFGLVRRAFGGLLDSVSPEATAAASGVLDGAVRAGRIIGWHKLRIRDAGARRFIEGHVQFAEGIDLSAAHEISEELEDELEQVLTPADAIIHAEPASEAR